MRIDPFIFDIMFIDPDHFSNDDREDCTYEITLGEQKIKSRVAQDGVDLMSLRDTLENFIITGKANIPMRCQGGMTTIALVRCDNSLYENDLLSGQKDDAKGIVNVNIEIYGPYSTVERRFSAFCSERQVIKELYEEFLFMSIAMDNALDRYNWKTENPYILSYNKIKSFVIEDYITGDDSERKNRPSQIKIKHFLRICADGFGYIYSEGLNACSKIHSDTVKLEIGGEFNDQIMSYSVYIPGLKKWHDDYMIATKNGEESFNEKDFDVDSWNERGLTIAKDLYSQLPLSIDVWYEYPYEDIKHRGCRPILIYNTEFSKKFQLRQ